MADLEIKAKIRELKGRANVRRLRRNNEIPAVVYGMKKPPLSLTLQEVDIQKSIRIGFHENALVKINIEDKGKASTVLIKEIQRHVISDKLIHIDFNEIALDEKIKAHVSTIPVGEPKGVKEQGGVLEHILHEVEVECLPADIPETIEVDVSALMIGDAIHIQTLPVGAKVEILNDPELTVFAVAAPKVEEEPEPVVEEVEGEGEAAEPEIVGQKGKKEEEGEAEEGKEAEKGAKEEKSEKKEKKEK